ncbi:MAG: hypothetical protein FWG62_07905 [Proteobacteria bacterium]|nr:hypothetical protein [Pseudomonadota bacterium]
MKLIAKWGILPIPHESAREKAPWIEREEKCFERFLFMVLVEMPENGLVNVRRARHSSMRNQDENRGARQKKKEADILACLFSPPV